MVSVFGRRLRWQRERAGLDTRPLAQRLGMARETLNRIENGHQGTRPNAHRVRRAAEVFGLPEYYFIVEDPKEVLARMVAELPAADLARLATASQRLAWSVEQLTALFPPQEFSLDALREKLGVPIVDFRRYCEGGAVPPETFIAGFANETGVPYRFLISGRREKGSLSYDEVIEEAQRRGVNPEGLYQALDALYPRNLGDPDP